MFRPVNNNTVLVTSGTIKLYSIEREWLEEKMQCIYERVFYCIEKTAIKSPKTESESEIASIKTQKIDRC